MEIYGIFGSNVSLIGTCFISFRELLIKNYDAQFGTSAVTKVNAIIQGESKSEVIGSLNVKLRMKHPINEVLHSAKDRAEILNQTTDNPDLQKNPTLLTRKLVVHVERAFNLRTKSPVFVFYKLYNLNDVCTKTAPSNAPNFNDMKTFNLPRNVAAISYLKKEALEFVVFDDVAPMLKGEDKNQVNTLGDVVGRARYHSLYLLSNVSFRVKLSPLINEDAVEQTVQILGLNNAEQGLLQVKVYWYDKNDPLGDIKNTENLTDVTIYDSFKSLTMIDLGR